MFGAQKLKIEIIDTLNPDKVLITEYTAAESPTFIVNGDEDKFSNLNTSELHFNMVVTSLEDGVFFHLFTGSEVRFKVLLLNFDDADCQSNIVNLILAALILLNLWQQMELVELKIGI